MTPEIDNFLSQDGETVINSKNIRLENLKQCLDEILCTLCNELNKEHFKLVLDLLVEQLVTLTFNHVHTNLEVRGNSQVPM